MLDVDEFVQEDVLIPIRVIMCIHSFVNGICSEESDFVICKFDVL